MPTSRDNPGVIALPPLLYLGTFVLALVLRAILRAPILEQGGFWPGLALIILGVALAVWGRQTMVRAGTNVDPSLPATTIVTSGPFRLTRNPLYVALTLLYLGLTLVANTWWGIVLLIPLGMAMHRGVVLREERYLESKFGERYREYRSRVRRYL